MSHGVLMHFNCRQSCGVCGFRSRETKYFLPKIQILIWNLFPARNNRDQGNEDSNFSDINSPNFSKFKKGFQFLFITTKHLDFLLECGEGISTLDLNSLTTTSTFERTLRRKRQAGSDISGINITSVEIRISIVPLSFHYTDYL